MWARRRKGERARRPRLHRGEWMRRESRSQAVLSCGVCAVVRKCRQCPRMPGARKQERGQTPRTTGTRGSETRLQHGRNGRDCDQLPMNRTNCILKMKEEDRLRTHEGRKQVKAPAWATQKTGIDCVKLHERCISKRTLRPAALVRGASTFLVAAVRVRLHANAETATAATQRRRTSIMA